MNEQAFIQSLQVISTSKSARKKLEAFLAFLHWQAYGGCKTAEVKRGEKIYQELQQRMQMTVVTA
jgi:hypothetical protein